MPARRAAAAWLRLIGGLVLAALAVYAGHRLLAGSGTHVAALLVSLGWLAALVLLAGLAGGRPVAALLAVAAGAAAALAARDFLLAHVDWIYFLQHTGTMTFLAGWFGLSLRRPAAAGAQAAVDPQAAIDPHGPAGTQAPAHGPAGTGARPPAGGPLITRLATRVHGPLPADVQRYTRAATVAWTVFFAAEVVVSVLLFAWAPLPVWSVFANLLTLPLVITVFIGEYVARHLCLPHFQHVSILEGVQAWRRRDEAPGTPTDPTGHCADDRPRP